MFEAIKYITPTIKQEGDSVLSRVIPLRNPEPANTQKSTQASSLLTDQAIKEGMKKNTDEGKQTEDKKQVTEQMLQELSRDIESIHDVGLTFSKHDASGRTMIKVTDKETGDVIREIPSEEVLNLAAKIQEMIGILFDKKA